MESIEHTFTYQRERKLRWQRMRRVTFVLLPLASIAVLLGFNWDEPESLVEWNGQAAVGVLEQYIDAQNEYFSRTGVYARSLQDLVVAGLVPERLAAADRGTHGDEAAPLDGYYFTLITRRGSVEIDAGDCPALCAFPDAYGRSGVMTYVIAGDGAIRSDDLNGGAPVTDLDGWGE